MASAIIGGLVVSGWVPERIGRKTHIFDAGIELQKSLQLNGTLSVL